MDLFELITNALSITGVKSSLMEGEDCWVVPATILREGVYPGSQGPLFYPGTVNKKAARAWNNIPIVVNHPQNQAGAFISARSPTVLEERGIGLVLNSGGTAGGDLLIEAWIRKERARAIVPKLATALENAEAGNPVSPINLSTGLFPTFVANAGEHKGRQYVAEVSGMEPDHVAILMDKTGACSVSDGCGLGIVANAENHLVVNAENSFDEISTAIARAINEEISSNAYLEAVYPSYFIFSLSGRKYYRQSYTFSNGIAKLSGAYTPVTRTVSYTPTITNNEDSTMSSTTCTCGGQAPVTNTNPAPAAPVAPAVPAAAPVANAVPAAAPVANAAPVNIYDNLAPEQQAQLQDALALAGEVRQGLVANIKANPSNQFTDAELAAMPSVMLKKMAGLGAPVANQNTVAGLLQSAYNPATAQAAIDNRGRSVGAAPVTNASGTDAPVRRPLNLPSSFTPPAPVKS